MKRYLTLLLIISIVLSLCACTGGGQSANGQEATFRVGFGRENITPQDSVPLGGYGSTEKRMSTGYLDYLLATCIAITDAKDNTILMFSQDLINSSQYKKVRAAVSSATGIPEENIMVSVTHTHSGPDQGSEHVNIGTWKTQYLAAVVKAAQAALEDRSPARIQIGRTETEGMNFVRHYLLDNGTYAGSNFGDFDSGEIVGHAEDNDPGLQVIKFIREAEDKQDIIMVNWQAHPCITGGSTETVISADFVGGTRDYLEKKTGDLFVYFTGAAGNQGTSSRIAGEEPTQDKDVFGQMLGDYVLEAMENMTSVETDEIKITKVDYVGQINHTMEDKIDQAREVRELFLATDRATGNALAREYGFSSVYHANAIINRSSMDETCTMGIYAISIGNISFITAPYEMFAAHGSYIKENTPFDMTFVMTVTNGGNGYIPTLKAHEYGCYESHTGKFTKETGDDLAATFVDMLNSLKNG